VNLLDENIVWMITGTTAWSGPIQGKAAMLSQLLGPLSAQLAKAPTFVAKRIIADGKIIELTGYLDTALVNTALEPPPLPA
jgi:ketosteroid isomerase-like protein